MGYGITDSKHYGNIADTLRQILETDETWTPAEMPHAILEAAAKEGGIIIWGKILGTIADQIDLQNALNEKVNKSDLGDMANVNDAPYDDGLYTRKNGEWSKILIGDMAKVNDAPYDDGLYSRKNGQWIEIPQEQIEDAPHDDKYYVRKNGQWVEIEVK